MHMYSEWSETEDTIGTALQVTGGSMDRWEELPTCWELVYSEVVLSLEVEMYGQYIGRG